MKWFSGTLDLYPISIYKQKSFDAFYDTKTFCYLEHKRDAGARGDGNPKNLFPNPTNPIHPINQ